MSRFHSYLNSGKQILQSYRGEEPFASFIKKYFAANKKYGSKDRKQISHLCYSFFRLGKAGMSLPIEERILTALFLGSTEPNELLAEFKPEWNAKVNKSLGGKRSMLNPQCSMLNVFPWKDELSDGTDHEKFCESFFVQPDLFLRIRPGRWETVSGKLQIAGCRFQVIHDNCISLPSNTKVDSILELDKEAVVQDLNSQEAGKYIQSAIENLQSPIPAWDCCAASGGKSIMAFDIDPGIELTVSDIRESIIANLKKRFQKAGIKKYKSFIADLTHDSPLITNGYRLIIADVPCTGSGTWSRTPEQLYFFDQKKMEEYASLQKSIVSNVIPHLLPGGIFIYITCSVFRKENEEAVEFIKEKFNMRVKQMPDRTTRSDGELLKGYDKKADSMFVAVFEKRL